MSAAVTTDDARAALDGVLDPELDRSIVDLGFVRDVDVDGGTVRITLELPTFWCAPALAWMIATDARRAVLRIPGVDVATVLLAGHHADAEITQGVNEMATFQEAFGGEVDGGLEQLASLFRRKAYLARLSRLAAELPGVEDDPTLTVESVPDSDEGMAYLAARAALGIDCSPAAPLLVDVDGGVVEDPRSLLRTARTVRVSLEGNALLCRALLEARQRQEARA